MSLKKNTIPSLMKEGLEKSKKKMETREGYCWIVRLDEDSETEGRAVEEEQP